MFRHCLRHAMFVLAGDADDSTTHVHAEAPRAEVLTEVPGAQEGGGRPLEERCHQGDRPIAGGGEDLAEGQENRGLHDYL